MARVVSGVVLGAMFFAVVWFGNTLVLLAVALFVGVLAFHEFSELLRPLGAAVPRLPALLATLAAIAIVPFPYVAVEAVVGIGLVGVAAGAMFGMARAAPGQPTPGMGTAATLGSEFSQGVLGALAGGFAIVYIGLALGALVGIHIFGGRTAVVLLIATIALSDTAQYYTGRLFGRHALAPRLSPKKTIEGAVGGFVAAPLFLYFVGPYLVPVVDGPIVAAIGIALVACGIAGDLFESMIKRAADMKDSAALIPGHGGVLDRIDALLFATPVFYVYLRWVYTG
jgi:phosphatidate cytidylyltransferase